MASVSLPNAGTGNLLDACKSRGVKPADLFAIEIDLDFQKILREKGYNLIGSDFLMYSDPYRFDLWLMNQIGRAHV